MYIPNNYQIFDKGDQADAFYIILQGEVSITSNEFKYDEITKKF